MTTKRNDTFHRYVLRPVPYVLSAAIAGVVALNTFHPKPSTGNLEELRPPKVNADGTPAEAARPILTNAQLIESERGKIPLLAGPARTVTGEFAYIRDPHPFGRVQVTVTVDAGRITDADITRLETYDPRSGSIAGFSLPVLLQSTLVANTAAYNHISSATYTAKGYTKSLQSALAKLPSPAEAEAEAERGGNGGASDTPA